MSRNKKNQRRSRKNKSAKFAYENLEVRMLLALAHAAPVSMYDDVFAPGAVTVEHIVDRAQTNEFVPNQIIIALAVPHAKNQASQFLQTVDWKALTRNPNASLIKEMLTMERGQNQSASLVHIDLGQGANPLAVVQRLAGNNQVLWSSPNFVHSGDDPREFTPNDPSYGSQYHHPLMQNNLAWDITLGNPAIRIGVTDDGVSVPHVDLNPNVWVNPGEVAGNGVDDDGNGYIDDVNGWDFSSNNNDPNPNGANDHGTHVAGITAGRTNNGIGIAGTAGLSTIVPLQFYLGTSSWTAAIINSTYTYAADNGVQIVTTSYNVDSWVGDPVFLAGLQYMYNAGVLHFNSAGNNNQLNPARQVFEESLFVSSTDAGDLKSSFSNYGTGIDIAAPGSNIFATILSNGYGTKSGTSMSTPNAAGAAALIWGANPSWNRDQVAARLLFFADNIDALNPTFAGLLGTGRANAFRALTNTLPAPRIKSFTGLPAAGSTTATWNVSSFTVAFNQVMDPASVNNLSNYVLREAGADGLFNTGDDQIRAITSAGGKLYKVGTNAMTFNITGAPLGPGKYQLSMLAGGLKNPFNTALDGDNNGTGGDAYVHAFTLEPATVKQTTLGSQIHEQTWSAAIGAAGQTVDYYISLDAGQKLTVISQPTGSLVPTIQVRNPAGTLIGSGALVGTSSVASNVPVSTAGRYRITFGGSGSSTGAYTARLLLNADIESESLNGATNNSQATAQNLDGSAVAFGTRGSDRLGALGVMASTSGTAVFSENFESGSLNANWATSTSNPAGRIRVIGTPSTAAGSFAMIMDVSTANTFNLNAATWTVNLSGLSSPTLRFSEASFADELHSMPASFVGSSLTDGVAISADGTNWFRVWTPAAGGTTSWTQRTVDLAAAATAAGISLGANFRIRFQQYDNSPVSTDGRGYDEISISVPAPQEDWYSFTLADGEYASVVGSNLGAGTNLVELYNSAGTLVSTGTSAANATSMISRYQDSTSNGVRDTYRVRVSGNATNYSLIVTRNADFDREANDTTGTGQPLTGIPGVFGFATTTPDVYNINATSGQLLSFSAYLPGGGSDQFINGLSSGTPSLLRMEIVNPSGTTVANGVSDVNFTANTGGVWSLRIFAQSGTGGEYYVQQNVSASVKVASGAVALVGIDPVQVNFGQTFVDPIVILSPPKNSNNLTPLIVSASNVTSTGFSMYITNWNGNSETNIFEEVSYIVVERGITQLTGGQFIVAGSRLVDDSGFFPTTFSQAFSTTPVVVPTTVSGIPSPPRAVRFNNITSTGFQVRTQFNQAGNVSADDQTTVNYIAMVPGRYTIGNVTIEAGLTTNTVTHNPFNLTFQQPFGGVPTFVANMQSYNDPDPAALRLISTSTTGATFYVQEETSFDPEVVHGNEQVGYVAFWRSAPDSLESLQINPRLVFTDQFATRESAKDPGGNIRTNRQVPLNRFVPLDNEALSTRLQSDRFSEKAVNTLVRKVTQSDLNLRSTSQLTKVDSFFTSFDESIDEVVVNKFRRK